MSVHPLRDTDPVFIALTADRRSNDSQVQDFTLTLADRNNRHVEVRLTGNSLARLLAGDGLTVTGAGRTAKAADLSMWVSDEGSPPEG